MTMRKLRYVCPHCGSENITATARIEWHEFGQYWRIAAFEEAFEEGSGACYNGECLEADFDPLEVEIL
jgi:hypothetical protein